MNQNDYQFLTEYLLNSSGLSLGDGKEYLLESRLLPLAQSMDLTDVSALVEKLKNENTESLRSSVTEAMTTNETSFFRDKTPFKEMADVLLPGLIKARQHEKRLRIWCVAASTGQEPYSIVMQIKESFPELDSWRIDILGTDIDTVALSRCQEGVYSQFEVQRGLPIQYLMKHFDQIEHGWKVKPHLQENIRWQQMNLLNEFYNLGPFDIVFCRNVLIYFETKTKGQILDRISKTIRSDGYLYLGAAETVIGISNAFNRFKECKSAVYCPNAEVIASLN